MSKKNYIIGCFEDENNLIRSIDELYERGSKIHDIYTPFPVHGLDEKLRMRQTKLHIAGFIYGTIGFILAFYFMSWVFAIDWKINFGGKPFLSIPAFIPIIFEFTVLSASVGMVLTFCYLCKIAPGVKKHHFHLRATDDFLVIVVEVSEPKEAQAIKQILKKTFAKEIDSQEIEVKDWWFGFYNKNRKLFEK